MIRIGVICPSEIAFRRFMPALSKCQNAEYVGIGVPSVDERFTFPYPNDDVVNSVLNSEYEKASKFVNQYGGKIFKSYEEIVTSNEIDAVYIPLPPALHFKWARKALMNGKHVLVEKPSTTNFKDTQQLIELAKNNNLALHENYMFLFHSQINEIDNLVKNGRIGEVRLIRISFGFPKRENGDFRYIKALGGGSLIDAGGYPIKYASYLLGETARITQACINGVPGQEVDIFGSGVMTNDNGMNVQFAFGMDNDYKCELEIWGSDGTLKTNRILTAPDGFVPTITISRNGDNEIIQLSADDSFFKSLNHFFDCIRYEEKREETYKKILKQAKFIEDFKDLSLRGFQNGE